MKTIWNNYLKFILKPRLEAANTSPAGLTDTFKVLW